MLDTLKISLKIDNTYRINSFIYNLRKLPILKDLITTDIYKSKTAKLLLNVIVQVFNFLKIILIRCLYFLSIIFLANLLNITQLSKTFIHIYFIFSIIVFFINNKLLSTSSKKYFSIIVFKMDSSKFIKSYLLQDLIKNILLNSFCFIIFNHYLQLPLLPTVSLILLPFFLRIVGESLNIAFYKKYSYVWINNYVLYFGVLITFLLLAIIPCLKVFVPFKCIYLTLILFIVLSIFALKYIFKVEDYKLIYKKINTKNAALSQDLSSSYSRQQMLEVKNKDIVIASKKLKNKKGYDLFNTIFFERHREILLRSAKRYSAIILIIYLILIYLSHNNSNLNTYIHNFLMNNSSYFILIMYFINRGAIVTQAMFFNCDHAMLKYNFYKEPKVLLGLFKKRLMTLIKVNLLPTLIIIIGNISLLFLNNEKSFLLYVINILYISSLSVFFSVHYLVIYYLDQPFNSEMQLKKISYTLITFLTYIACYYASFISMNNLGFCLISIIFAIFYTLVSLYLVYKYSPKTFKIN